MSVTSTVPAAGLVRLLREWDADGSSPAYLALARATAGLVVDAKLPLGARVPAERDLAQALRLSRTTVSAAYDLLRRHGYLISRRGAGTWTALPRAVASMGNSGASRGRLHVLPHLHDTRESDVIDLSLAAPSAPPQVQAAVETAAAELPRYLAGHGYDTLGLAVLRERIASLYDARGLPTTADQILVTAGAQQAIALVLGALAGPGDRVVVESPTYPVALQAVRGHAARAVPIDVGPHGWEASTLETFGALLRQSAPVLAYLVADFHNPTGALMPDEMRAAVVATARRGGTYVIADETDVDLALEPAPALPAPLGAFDPTGRVVSIGSTSKTIWGGLRVGWIRAEPTLVHRMAAVRARLDMASPPLEQLIVTALLDQHAEIVAYRCRELRVSRDAFVAALGEQLPTWRVPVPVGGLSLWVELDAPISTALAAAAPSEGLRLGAGSRFGTDATFERRLRLPFTLPPEQLVEAARRLAVLRDGSLASAPAPARAELVL